MIETLLQKTILVTGAGGQLGKEFFHLAQELQVSNYKFIFQSKEGLPIDDFGVVKNYFEKEQIDYCINCAAYTIVDAAENEKENAFIINADAVGNLAKICNAHQAKFIHISTDYVFDGTSTVPYKEVDAVAPSNVYGTSKLKGEELAFNYNPSSIIIRTSWLYSLYNKNFLKTMLRLMKEKESVNVVNDQYGCPTYAKDLAIAILLLIEKENNDPDFFKGILHYCNSGITTWYDFAEAIKEMTKSDCKIIPIPTSSFPTPAKRPHYSVLDTTKIKKLLGIKIPSWKHSLKNCLNINRDLFTEQG